MKNKPQLGKGMAALLGNNPSLYDSLPDNKKVESGAEKKTSLSGLESNSFTVDLEKVIPNKEQPRKIFKEKDLIELSESIKENGIIQPLVVIQNENKFEIIAGERRYRAAKLAGLKQVPIILKKATKRESLVMAIVENIQRSDLNCIEEGLAYFQLMNEYNLTQEEVAKKVGKERSTIANFLRILKLPKEVIMNLQKEVLSFGHAKILVAVGDDEKIKRYANEAITNSLSVRELEILIKKDKKQRTPGVDQSKYADDQYQQLKEKLERQTGFHFGVKSKKNGAGEILIKFSNEAEFNDIFTYLMK